MALSKIDESSWGGAQFGRRNVLYNGNMEVNQRGVTSYTGLTGFNRGCDGWSWAKNDVVNFDAEYDTFSTSFTDVPGARGYMSFTLNSAGSGTDFVTIQQRIEDVRTLAGEEVTLTFWARSNTGSSFTLTEAASISHGPVALQQIFGTGGSATVNHNVASSMTLNTTWTKYTYTTTLPSVSGKTLGTNHHLRLYLCTMMDSDAGKGVEIAQVQLERGSRPTPFELRSYAEELALCQRFYWRNDAEGPSDYNNLGVGVVSGSNTAFISVNLPQKMRAQPSLSYSSLSDLRTTTVFGGGGGTPTSVVLGYNHTLRPTLYVTDPGGQTFGQSRLFGFNGTTTGWIAFDAEL